MPIIYPSNLKSRSPAECCMHQLDNPTVERADIAGLTCGVLVFLGILSIVIGSSSCRKGSTEGPTVLDNRPISASIAEADGLYAQRGDLVKVREALIALRQAMAGHPADYDLAWRVAKFNYYLGSHTTEEGE